MPQVVSRFTQIADTLSITQGGTGATTASAARTALGLGTLATQSNTLSGTNTGDISLGTANGLTLAGQSLSLPTSATPTFASLTATTGTITTNQPGVNVTQAWNSGAVIFTAIHVNVTATASSTASMLMDLQTGGTSRVSALRSGEFVADSGNIRLGNIGGSFQCIGFRGALGTGNYTIGAITAGDTYWNTPSGTGHFFQVAQTNVLIFTGSLVTFLIPTSATTITANSLRLRVNAPATASTVTVDNSSGDVVEQTISGATITISAPTSTPATGTSGRILLFLAQHTGGSHGTTLMWNSGYAGSATTALPTAAGSTVAGKIDFYEFVYNRGMAKWCLVRVLAGFN
jgi:hypothetical protein